MTILFYMNYIKLSENYSTVIWIFRGLPEITFINTKYGIDKIHHLSLSVCSCWNRLWWSRNSSDAPRISTWPRTHLTPPWRSTRASVRWSVWRSRTNTSAKSRCQETSLLMQYCTKVHKAFCFQQYRHMALHICVLNDVDTQCESMKNNLNIVHLISVILSVLLVLWVPKTKFTTAVIQ